MVRKRQYESAYAGYVYEKPVTYWTSTEEVKKRLIKNTNQAESGYMKLDIFLGGIINIL